MDTQEYLQSLVDAACAAQKEFEKMSQEQVDAAAKAIGKAIYDHAEGYCLYRDSRGRTGLPVV